MNKQTRIGMILGIVFVMLLLVWLFSPGGDPAAIKNGKKARTPFVSSNWSKRFQIDDKNPQGLYLFTALTQAHLNKGKEVRIIDDAQGLDSVARMKKPKTYMFVGLNFGLENREMDSILKDVYKGSCLFLGFEDLTKNLYDKLFESRKFRFDYSENITIYVKNKGHKMINLFQNDTIARDWRAFGKVKFKGDHITLSSFMEMPNFLRVEHGSGFIYLHSTPCVFYNYQVKRNPGYMYTSFVLNNIPKNQDIYLLELGRLSDNYGDYDVEEEGPGGKEDNSLLQAIFNDPNLLTALLLCILGLILFVIFRSKRTRPIVPFIDKKKDMTLAFAETITSIYFAKRNAYGLLQVQRKNFYDTIHRHFFVDLAHREGESDRSLEILAEKSNTPVEELRAMINALETKQASAVTEETVARIAKQKHNFYKRVGIISEALSERLQMKEMVFKRALWIPILLILGGVALIIIGLGLLMTSIGVGIALWPIGLFLLVLGSMRISKPYLVIEKTKIRYYSPFGVEKEFDRSDLIATDVLKTGVVLNFKNDRKLIINYWDLSAFDRIQFERFVSRLHMQEL